MDKAQKRILDRKHRAVRVRKKIVGTSKRPRLCVRRSLNHLFVQVVDDETGKSIVQTSSIAKDILEKVSVDSKLNKVDIAKLVGEKIAELAKNSGIQQVVFDRKGYLYHGRVKALADAARSKGLIF